MRPAAFRFASTGAVHHRPLMFRHLVVVCLGLLGGCAKSPDLPDIIVNAASPGEFARFRADLGARFTAEQLQPFDTATQELQLQAMSRGIAMSDGRAQFMLDAVNGRPVHAAVLLGWQARKERFLREIAELTRMLAHDLDQQAKTGADTPASILARIQSEREVIAGIQRNLAETESRLAELKDNTKKQES